MNVSVSHAKHAPGSLRGIGLAQFAAYGYKALSAINGSLEVAILSAAACLLLEGDQNG